MEQLIYGSTPYSAGYSILGKSPNIDEELEKALIQKCETWDSQRHSAPFSPYSIAIWKSSANMFVFTEVFGNWRDQEGRPSRVMRNICIEKAVWDDFLAGNPFLLSWISPSVKKSISTKRNEIKELPSIDLQKITQKDRERIWHLETKRFLRSIAKLSREEKKVLFYLQKQETPFSPRILLADCEKFEFCRTLVYSIPASRRGEVECRSFSLNTEEVKGLSFRYSPYCDNAASSIEQMESTKNSDISLHWKMETIIKSLPDFYNSLILAKNQRERDFLSFLFYLPIGILIGYLISFAL